MQSTSKIPELDSAGLRNFALVTASVFVILFGVFLPWLFDASTPFWPFILAGLLAISGLIVPDMLRPVYRAWMRLGMLLSKVTTPIIMAVVYYLLIVPTGLIRRLFARDPLERRLSDDSSYRKICSKGPAKNMERPF